MTSAHERIGIGTRLMWDGTVVEVIELRPGPGGTELGVKETSGARRAFRLALREVLFGARARIVPSAPGFAEGDGLEPASTTLSNLTPGELDRTRERAAHVREVLTGYRSGSAEIAAVDEPHPEYGPRRPLYSRYRAKAAELGVSVRTVESWVSSYKAGGEAALARSQRATSPMGRASQVWIDVATEVMAEHTELSRPSRTRVIDLTNARVTARFGEGVVVLPSRATAFRLLAQLERTNPLFRLSTKRNRDIADRPETAYGKLRPTRPGEYLLMDTTRLDVFGLDPVTLEWVQAELTVAMDWYTRCIVGMRLTPVSTKSVDAATVLLQAFRPPPAGKDWPEYAAWPEHGIPRAVLVDRDAIEGPMRTAAHPAIVPETVVIDHGKIYVSEHLTSVCQRMGISIQPARLRTGRDKAPVERFFRTLREDLLQALPGYKGQDVFSRGEEPEAEAFFFLNELEDIIREWVAIVYHQRPHEGLVEPHLPAVDLSPATMFERGVAAAGYLEAPRDPDLGLEFLATEWRTIQHYGVEYHGRRYDGPALNAYRNRKSHHAGPAKGRWPFQVHPDDITRIYFRDPSDDSWHELMWEHALDLAMPLSDEALRYARRLAATRYTYPDDKLAMADLLERWHVGLGSSRSERRMALRMARENADLLGARATDGRATHEPAPVMLPSVVHVLAASAAPDTPPTPQTPPPQDGDDDEFDELDLDDFYADALDGVE